MSNEKIIKKLDEYIDDWQENPQYAVMVDGEWGCGKTYFIKEYINERNDNNRLAWYISVFGVKNVEEIDEKIFEAAHPIFTDKKQKKWLALSYNVLRGAAKHKLGIDLKDFFKPGLELFKYKEDAYSSCQVLFVDDIERANIPLKELFGYFSQIVDKETRVVFVANKGELEYQEGYNELQEKLILDIYKIEPDYEKSINKFWQNELDDEFSDLKIKAKEIAKKINEKNLRNIHRVIFTWKQLLHNLPKEIKSEADYIGDIFEEFFILYNNYIAGKYKEINIDEMQELDKVLSEMRKMMKDFYQTNYYPELRGGSIWPKVIFEKAYDDKEWIMKQFLDAHKLYSVKEKERKESNNNLNKLKKYMFYNSDEKDIKIYFESLLVEFDKGIYTRFDEIMTFIQVYINFMYGKILPKEYNLDNLIRILCKFMDGYKEDIYALPGIERTSKENLMHVNDEKLQKCIYELFEAARLTMGCNLEEVFFNKDKFLAFISEPQRAITDITDIKFLEKLNLDNVFNWLSYDVNEHKKLLKFLEFRYRKNFANDTLHKNDYSEIEYVEKIKMRYDKMLDSLVHSFRLDYRDYREIRDEYVDLEKYMKKEIAGNQGV